MVVLVGMTKAEAPMVMAFKFRTCAARPFLLCISRELFLVHPSTDMLLDMSLFHVFA